MSLKSLIRLEEANPDLLKQLSSRMADFYRNPRDNYYGMADRAAESYTVGKQPFHCHLVSQVQPGETVLEVGCGTAHLCAHVEGKGGIYHGLDHSPDLLNQNRIKFPKALFWEIGSDPVRQYDLVSSLYTIEHVTEPTAYLQKLWNYCRPGGKIGIICPDFIDGEGIAPCVYFGKSAGRLRNKLSSGQLGDALLHLWELKVAAARWKQKAQAMPPGAFWINSSPAVLAGMNYDIDRDAVHLPRLIDLVDWFEKKSAEIVVTSLTLTGVSREVLKHNCYLLVRKPS